MYYKNGNSTQENFTATPEKYPQKRFNPRDCRRCGETFQPVGPSHLYCSQPCADSAYDDKLLKRVYGISRQDYTDMLLEQDYKCKICSGEGFLMSQYHRAKLVVDHDHKTGEIRGLLCHNCNRALGLFQDSADNLAKAKEYLEGATTSRKT